MTLVLALCGGTAVGKTTLAAELTAILPAVTIGTDSYIEPRATRVHSPNDPCSVHLDDLVRDVEHLRKGEPVWIGTYNHETGQNNPATRRESAPLVVLEGAHALHGRLRPMIDVSIFSDATEAFMRRSRRQRDEQLGNADHHWNQRWPEHYRAYQEFILPQREHADIVLVMRDY